VVYTTIIGGSQNDIGKGIGVDVSGNAYITGSTLSTDFPATTGALQTTPRGKTDAFVAKISPLGMLTYVTFIGGNGDDSGNAMAVDDSGTVYITGSTASTDFPIAPAGTVLQSTLKGTSNAFVTKLASTGASIVYSTYLGGSGTDVPHALAIDPVKN